MLHWVRFVRSETDHLREPSVLLWHWILDTDRRDLPYFTELDGFGSRRSLDCVKAVVKTKSVGSRVLLDRSLRFFVAHLRLNEPLIHFR